jgi:hypothetical protein
LARRSVSLSAADRGDASWPGAWAQVLSVEVEPQGELVVVRIRVVESDRHPARQACWRHPGQQLTHIRPPGRALPSRVSVAQRRRHPARRHRSGIPDPGTSRVPQPSPAAQSVGQRLPGEELRCDAELAVWAARGLMLLMGVPASGPQTLKASTIEGYDCPGDLAWCAAHRQRRSRFV